MLDLQRINVIVRVPHQHDEVADELAGEGHAMIPGMAEYLRSTIPIRKCER